MNFLKEVIKGIHHDLNDLDSNIFECDENGDCVAESEEFKRLLKKMQKFVNNYKQRKETTNENPI